MDSRQDRRRRSQDFQTSALRVLTHLKHTVGLDVWAVGRSQDDDWMVLSSIGLPEGTDVVSWSSTLCAQVRAGHATWATPDIDAVPALAQARDTLGLNWRSFVTVPLLGEEGQVLGTLCGAGSGPARDDLEDCRQELDVLADVLAALLSSELRLEREMRHREVAEHDAQTDPLTGLGNRRRWDERLAAEEERCRRYANSAAVVTVDVDGLKLVNDRWGHDAGDALLQQLAAVLRRECRPGDVIARLGGDEFAVLLAETGTAQAQLVTERLRTALDLAHVPASIGVAVRSRAGLAGAWRDADAVMYAAKRARVPMEPADPGPGNPSGSSEHDGLVDELLALARGHIGADIAFIGRFEGSDRVLRAVQSSQPIPVGPGHTEALETTYCQRIIDGVLPNVIPDTSREPKALELAITAALPIGAYLGVPVHLPGGRRYGTLCCLSHEPSEAFDSRAVAFLESVARSLSRVLGSEENGRDSRRRILADIDDLLRRDGVHMAYQPIVDLVTGDHRGMEALARFEKSDRSPTQWFADAERVDRTAELELHAAKLALQDWSWDGDLWLNLSASVLVSPAACALLEQQDLSRLVLEISEHEQVPDYTLVRRTLAPWRERGLRLAVDDAGAGFASLRHVLELTPEVIKLDITLVQGLPTDQARRALVGALVAFAAQSRTAVVAEGVETQQELEVLLETGVLLAQGFHLGRPGPVPQRPSRLALRPTLPTPRPAQVTSWVSSR